MFTPDNPFHAQVQLLVRALPVVAGEKCFALKGGTAINLFVREMPRLSVDIDLAFVPVSPRDEALQEIDAALKRIAVGLQDSSPQIARVRISKTDRATGLALGLIASSGRAEIKIEISPVLRGSVYPEELRRIVKPAEEEFGFAELSMLSLADLYAGKIVAALDRQHPRDLFDVRLLLANEGISPEMFKAFLIYAASHDGSLARILDPRPKAIADLYEKQFVGMTAEPVSLAELEQARSDLIARLHRYFDQNVCSFLLSFKQGEPKWERLGIRHAAELPAIRWKLRNLESMAAEKRKEAIANLEAVLNKVTN